MRVLNCCLALVLFGTSACASATATANGGWQGVRVRNINNGNGKKSKANANNRSLQQQPQADEPSPASSSSSFVLADKVAALSPSDKHRLEQLLASGGLDTTSDNNSDNENQHNQLSQGRRKTMKAEQSDTNLYIGNNADSDNDNDDNDNEEEQVFQPEAVTADPRELPLPSDAETGNGNGEDDTNENAAGGVNVDSSTNGNNNDDGRGTDASDDWQMNTRFDDSTTDGAGSDGTANGTNGNGSDAGVDNNAAEETDGAGTGGSIFDNGDGNGNDNDGENSEAGNNGNDATSTSPNTTTARGDNDDSNANNSKPTFPDDAAPRCQLDQSTGLFGSASDPESNSGLAKSTIVRYTYEVEFDLSKVERLMKALPKMENALGDALVPDMFEECAEEQANDSNSQALDNGWVKPPPGVEISDERDRARSTDNDDSNVNVEDGLRRRMKQTAAMKLIRRAKEIDGVVGFSSAPEDRVVGGEPCSVLNPPVDNGCIKVEGQLTLHLAQEADDRRAVEATQDVIATTMASGDLADVDPSIIAVEYVADGLYEPATTQVTLNSSDENNQGGGGGSFPYAIAGGAAAALVGVALIGVGVKKHRNRNSGDDQDSEGYGIDEMGSSIPDELNSSDEHDLGKEAAYDMAKLASPQSSHMTFDTTEISDPSTTMSSPGPVMNESALVSVNETALISTSADLGPIIEMPSNEDLDADGKLGIERPYNDESEFVGVGIAQQLDDCDNHSTLFGSQHHGHGGSMTGSRSAQSGTGSLASVDGRGSILNDIV